MIASDITNVCCQSTLKYVMHGILGIITQGKLHNNRSSIVCHKLLSSLGTNKNWHIHFFAVVELLAETWFVFFQHNSNFTENFIETDCPAHGSWKESFKHILRQNWEAISLHKQQYKNILKKYILYLHIVTCTHYREKEGTVSFLMTTALGSGTWRPQRILSSSWLWSWSAVHSIY